MAHIADEDFENEFSTFNYPVLGNDELCDKLREMCTIYHRDAAGIFHDWMAFAHSRKIKLVLNLENLEQMQREMNKGSNKPSKTLNKLNSTTIYDAIPVSDVVDDDAADELLGAYSTPNSKSKKKRQHTPDMVQNKRLTGLGRSPAVPFSPSSFSPVSNTPSQKYNIRKYAGDVVGSFGVTKNARWSSSREDTCVIKSYDQTKTLSTRFKYMFQKMADKAHVLNDLIEEMGDTLKEHYNTRDYTHISIPAQEQVTVCGRVCCDSNGKLNAQSVVLEGSRETSSGKQIPVDLSGVSQYSLFPGQIVAVDGINNTGNKLVAKKFYENQPLPLASCEGVLSNGPLSVVIATGPFTTTDNAAYEPLKDFVDVLNKNPPDVCILLGPFIDCKNPDVEKLYGNKPFEEYFKEWIDYLVRNTSRIHTQFVILPSQRDAHCDCVYPQPPYNIKKDPKERPTQKLHFVSDPCTLSIDGVVFGITSTDILFHLGAEEISYYYPLYPPCDEVNVDYEQYEHYARLPVTPHVLVIPSELKTFIKDINGCCCVNPGRLAKGQIGGTYSRLVISPPSRASSSKSLSNSIAGQIIKI